MDFDFTMSCAPRCLGQAEHEIRNLGGVLAINDFAAVRRHVRFELFQVVVQVFDGVPLEGVGLGAQFLVIGQRGGRYGMLAMVDQAAGGPIDGQLQIGIGQRLVDLLIECDRHCVGR